MADHERDPIGAAFADFRRDQSPMLRPAGLAPVRATVRRRRMAAVAILVVIAIAAPAIAYAALARGHQPPVIGDPSPTPSTAGTPSATSSAIAACRADQLTGAVTDQANVASQPMIVVALTNTSASSCHLTGYPHLTAAGYTTPTTTDTLPLTVSNGAIYERTDPGPHRIDLAPGGSASFALGTGTAYDGGAHLFTITRVDVVVPGATTAIAVATNIAASAPGGQPIPVTVTAFVAGRTGPPQ